MNPQIRLHRRDGSRSARLEELIAALRALGPAVEGGTMRSYPLVWPAGDRRLGTQPPESIVSNR